MEPGFVASTGLASGLLFAALALRTGHDGGARGPHVQDFCVVGWFAISATGFLGAAHAALVAAGVRDLALLGTVRLALVLAFVLGLAALVAAAGHLVRRSPSSAARAQTRHV